MVSIDKKNPGDPAEAFMNIITKSTILAIIMTVPALGIFLGIYYGTGNLIVGAVLGFGAHFVVLAFSGRISNWLVKFRN